MPLGSFEREVLAIIASNRNPESYVGGATVLHQSPDSLRTSKDIDIFNETVAALAAAKGDDSCALEKSGYEVYFTLKSETFSRAIVSKDGKKTKLEWLHDSAFRFYPVEQDEELGYRLNFWDAATNKALAGCGRAKIRDYIDLIEIHQKRLSLGALVWAASGKDDGLNPRFIIEEMSRVQRYPLGSIAQFQTKEPLEATTMKRIWMEALRTAVQLFDTILTDAPLGCLFLDEKGKPVCPTIETLPQLKPHFGSVRGAWPRIVED